MLHPKNPFLALRAPLKKLYETACALEAQGNLEAASAAYQDMMAQTTEYKEILELISFRLKDPVSVALTVQAAATSTKTSLSVEEDLLFFALQLKYDTLMLPIEKAHLARYLALFFLYEAGDFERAWYFFQVAMEKEPVVLTSSDWEEIAEFYRNNISEEDGFIKILTVLKLFFYAAQVATTPKSRSAAYENIQVFLRESIHGEHFQGHKELSERIKRVECVLFMDFLKFIQKISGSEEEIKQDQGLPILKTHLGEDRYLTLLIGYLHCSIEDYVSTLDFFVRFFEKGLPDACKDDGVREAYRLSLISYVLRFCKNVYKIEDPHERFLYLMSLTAIALDIEERGDARVFLSKAEDKWFSSTMSVSEEERARFFYLKNRVVESRVKIILSSLYRISSSDWKRSWREIVTALIKNINALRQSEKNSLYSKIINENKFWKDGFFVGFSRADWGILLWQSCEEIDEKFMGMPLAQPKVEENKLIFNLTPMMLAASVGYIGYALHIIRSEGAKNLVETTGDGTMSALELAVYYHQSYFLKTVLLYVDVRDSLVSEVLVKALGLVKEDLHIAGLLFYVLRQLHVVAQEANVQREGGDIKAVASSEVLKCLISRGLDCRYFKGFRGLLLRCSDEESSSLLARVNQWINLIDVKTEVGVRILKEVLCLGESADESHLCDRLSAVERLINAGVELNAEIEGKTVLDAYISTLFDYQVCENHSTLLHFLINQGAKIAKGTEKTSLSIFQAVRMNDLSLANHFLKQGASVNAVNPKPNLFKQVDAIRQVFDSVIAHEACYDKIFPALMSWYRVLLSQGADQNAIDTKGDTLIHVILFQFNISLQSKLELVKLFLEYHVSLDIPDRKNQYPLTIWLEDFLADRCNQYEVTSPEYTLFSLLFENTDQTIRAGLIDVLLQIEDVSVLALRWFIEEKKMCVTQAHMQTVMRVGDTQSIWICLKSLQRMCYLLPHYLNTLQDNKAEEETEMKDWIREKLLLIFSMAESRPNALTEKILTGVQRLLTVYLDATLLPAEIARKKEWILRLCQERCALFFSEQRMIREEWARCLALPERAVALEKVNRVENEFIAADSDWTERLDKRVVCWMDRNKYRLLERLKIQQASSSKIISPEMKLRVFRYLQGIADKSFREEEFKIFDGIIKNETARCLMKNRTSAVARVSFKRANKFDEPTRFLMVDECRSSLEWKAEILEVLSGEIFHEHCFLWVKQWLPLFLIEVFSDLVRRTEIRDSALHLLALLEENSVESKMKARENYQAFEALIRKAMLPAEDAPRAATYFFSGPMSSPRDTEAAVASTVKRP